MNKKQKLKELKEERRIKILNEDLFNINYGYFFLGIIISTITVGIFLDNLSLMLFIILTIICTGVGHITLKVYQKKIEKLNKQIKLLKLK